MWAHYFEQSFGEIYTSIHRFETNRIRNLSKLFAYILTSDAISWPNTLRVIHLTEADTTSASRVFIKFLFLEISQEIGIPKLNQILHPKEPSMEWQEGLSGIFPMTDLRSMRFAINFFTAIELGPLTDRLREAYDQMQSQIALMEQQKTIKQHPEYPPSEDDGLNLSDVSLSEDEGPSQNDRQGRNSGRTPSYSPKRRTSPSPRRRRSPSPKRHRDSSSRRY